MIYTSRYQNPELKSQKYTVVGITRGQPKFKLDYKVEGNIIEIAPPGYLFQENNRERFTPAYFRHMDRSGVKKISAILSRYEMLGKPVVLCCYEDVRNNNDWCHRLVFADWWLARTGEYIEELPDPSPAKKLQRPKEEVQEPQVEQLRMW